MEGEGDHFLLLVGQALVERGDQRFWFGWFDRGCVGAVSSFGHGAEGQRGCRRGGDAGDGGSDERSSSDRTAALAGKWRRDVFHTLCLSQQRRAIQLILCKQIFREF